MSGLELMRIITVSAGGSSRVLRKALDEERLNLSAPLTITTRFFASSGLYIIPLITSLIAAILISPLSGSSNVKSGCMPDEIFLHDLHRPQASPLYSAQFKAMAKLIAAHFLPIPSGP